MEKYLKDISDIYILKNYEQELLAIERFGKKKIDNLLNAIEESKNNNLDQFIFGLGIHYIGAKASKTLAKAFTSIDALKQASSLVILGSVPVNTKVKPLNLSLISIVFDLGSTPYSFSF